MEANQRFFPASFESLHFRSRGQFCGHLKLYPTKAISYTVNSNGKEVEQAVHKHPTSCSSS